MSKKLKHALTFGLRTIRVNPSLQPKFTRVKSRETSLSLQNNPLHVSPDPEHCARRNLAD
jgi:hypothetical protein